MIYFIAALIFLFFALTILCIFGIIAGVTGIRDVNARRDPHWGLNVALLRIKHNLQQRVASLAISLFFNLLIIAGLISVAYHLQQGPIS